MKLKDSLKTGMDCGLQSLGEAILNIEIHAGSLFSYSDIRKEIDELKNEKDILLLNTEFSLDSKIEDVEKWLSNNDKMFSNYTLMQKTIGKIENIIREEEHYAVSTDHPNQADYDSTKAKKFQKIWNVVSDFEKNLL